MSSPGGGSDVSISFGGNVQPLQQAAQQAQQAVNSFAQQVRQAAQQTSDAASAFDRVRAVLQTLRQETALFGPAQAQQARAWLDSSRSADEFRARLEYLNAQMRLYEEQQRQTTQDTPDFTGQLNQMGIGFASVGFNIGGMNVNLGQMLSNFGTFGQVLGPAALLVGAVGEAARPVVDLLTQAADTALQFAENLAGEAMQQGINTLEQMTQQVFQLNEATEKNYTNLLFLWGGVSTDQTQIPGYAVGTGPGLAPATQLMQWSKTASLYMPFTRQDLMGAIKTSSIASGSSVEDVEHHLDMLSDVTSTQGADYMTLRHAAMAALRGGEGYSRMLLMDLNLTPQKLEPFGYVQGDDTTFWPALEGYLKTKGSLGASKYIATHTFWGAQTSFVDRLQNMGLDIGGWNDNPQNASDDVKQGSMFRVLRDDLVGVSDWMNAHADDLQHVADILMKIFGGASQDATTFIQALFKGLSGTGIDRTILQGLDDFGTWLSSPEVQQTLKMLGDALGTDIGTGLNSFIQALSQSGLGQDIANTVQQIGQWLGSPDVQKGISTLGTVFGQIAGSGAKDVFDAAKQFLAGLGDSGAGKTLMDDLKQLGDWFADPSHQVQIQAFGYAMGIALGDIFNMVSADIKTLLDQLGGLFAMMQDLANHDFAKFAADAKATEDTFKQDTAAAEAADAKAVRDAAGNTPNGQGSGPTNGIFGSNGASTPPPAIGAQVPSGAGGGGSNPSAGVGAGIAGAFSGLGGGGTSGGGGAGSSGAPGDGPVSTSGYAAALGGAHAQAYVIAFHNTFKQNDVGSLVLNDMNHSISTQISQHGSALATQIVALIQQQIASGLTHADLLGNADRRAAGGAGRFGIGLGVA